MFPQCVANDVGLLFSNNSTDIFQGGSCHISKKFLMVQQNKKNEKCLLPSIWQLFFKISINLAKLWDHHKREFILAYEEKSSLDQSFRISVSQGICKIPCIKCVADRSWSGATFRYGRIKRCVLLSDGAYKPVPFVLFASYFLVYISAALCGNKPVKMNAIATWVSGTHKFYCLPK